MDLFTELFEHQRELQVIICRTCTIAIPPSQICTHLKSHHSKIPASRRHDVADAAHTVSDLAWRAAGVRIRKPAGEAVASLGGVEDAFLCTFPACWYVCTTLRQIRKHCTDDYRWVGNQRRGGDMKKMEAQPSNRMWKEGQSCQRVFRAAGWPAYMVVRTRPTASRAIRIGQNVLANRQTYHEKRQALREQAIIRESHRVNADAWLDLTAWVPHLTGCSRALLLGARQLPEAKHEHGLNVACKAMRRVIRKAFQNCRFEVVGRHTLELIERRETGAPSNEKPFYAR
jgi:hypothetical protein